MRRHQWRVLSEQQQMPRPRGRGKSEREGICACWCATRARYRLVRELVGEGLRREWRDGGQEGLPLLFEEVLRVRRNPRPAKHISDQLLGSQGCLQREGNLGEGGGKGDE